MKKTCKVMLARFPGDFKEHPESSNYILKTYKKCLEDPRIEEVLNWHRSDTPITMTRNLCLEHAQQLGMDFVLMIDNDMKPDQDNPGCKPFWDSAFDFCFDRKSPAIVAAPYVGPGTYHNNVYAFHWESLTNAHFPIGMRQFTRFEAMQRSGIEKVGAMPTGLMLIDMRILSKMRKPYFEYDWMGDGPCCDHCGQPKPGPRAVKASTEDCFFTREITLGCFDDPDAGVFCNWDAWAYHIKLCELGKPEELTIDMVNKRFVDAVLEKRRRDETVKEWGVELPHVAAPLPADGGMRFSLVDNRNGTVSLDEQETREVIRARFPEYTGNGKEEV